MRHTRAERSAGPPGRGCGMYAVLCGTGLDRDTESMRSSSETTPAKKVIEDRPLGTPGFKSAEEEKSKMAEK